MRLLILLSTKNFSWVYQLKKPLSMSESYKQEGDPLFVTQRCGYAILPINLEQVAIQTLSELAIVNLKTRKLDYKVKFIYSMNLMLTSSQGVLSVPRIHNGILIEFGSETYSDSDTSHEVLSFRTMNDVHYKFQCTYGNLIKGFYLCIDESIVDWDSRQKLLPICIQYRDFIYTK